MRANRIDPLVCPRGHHSVSISAERIHCDVCHNNGHETRSWDKSELVDLREEEPPLAGESDG